MSIDRDAELARTLYNVVVDGAADGYRRDTEH
jgi:hypothetical protein